MPPTEPTTPPRPLTNNRILWLASYPKSGNTWLRFLLRSAVLGPPTESIQVAASIPDIHRPLPTDGSAASFGGLAPIKTHFALSPTHPRRAQTAKAIYVLRHPKDVLLSGLNYTRLAGSKPSPSADRAYAEAFIASGGDRAFEAQGFGAWASHARSWGDADFPVHTIRYEDLQADAAGVLRGVLGFIDQALSEQVGDESLLAAVKASSFDNLRALEVREKHNPGKQSLSKRLFVGDQAAARQGAFFMNRGQSGQSLGPIGPGLDEAFDAAFAESLAEFGYA
ncbi:MAG: hypothetical protein ACI89L_000638 [Phycisphaerales bacterium]|jgi:hypothetical protein